ncbi:class I SAM-dependent DNA methyltransferase [Helicobacter pylori]|uniref:type IIG restriction enzyme/methyltransferase n=1 Tax=Helicobacter pylori TaxID=210 RepID=UPI001125CB9F|nr:class I SAM-dependent DNA methyltransferase [Helicobacter pylori]TPH86196.1 class I SAM-dependent DNA methyltransferase [Helicobacter pylori]
MIRFTRIPLKDFIKKYNPPTPTKETIENFKKEINSLLENAPRQDDEEFQKNEINSFLKNTYGYRCNTNKKVDSAIYMDEEVQVLIEVKALNKKTEFPKNKENPLSKAFCQMVLYFLEEIKNNSLKHTIICNAHEFFLFDCKDLLFLNDDRIKKFYKNYAQKEGTDSSKPKFYKDLEQYLREDFQGELRYTHFNLNDDFKELPLIYQVLSQEVLLKQKKTIDANTLNKDFYEELLYILGLEEKNEKGKILIKPSRTENSLSDALKKQYKNLDDEEVMALLIAWNNRILFLRLLESLLISFKHFEKPFLTTENFNDFNALNTLFFEVLAKKNNERLSEIKEDKILEKIPYLNSSLFDQTDLELKGYRIRSLNNEPLEIYPKSVLKKHEEYQEQKDSPLLLEYLFEFLRVYDFTTTPKDIKDNQNTSESVLINPSVLGLVFEKLNGYKEGSFYTPSFITGYMCKESITSIVLDKFNQTYNIECENLTELKNYFKDNYSYKEDKRKEYLNTLLTLRICDPAVGSGHFLVSALNEMVFIAYELGLIASLYRHSLRLENDEIIIHAPTGEIFNYTKPHSENDPHHQIQKELFELKKSIIENCLFGVDINPNSCEITKLRLWIELLKYSYYIFEEGKNTNALETLPNIDINIKCGNSLISRFSLHDDLKKIPNIKQKIQEYKDLVAQYKDPNPFFPLNKADLTNKIQDLKTTFSLELKDPKTKAELEKAIEKHIKNYNDFALDDKSLLDGLEKGVVGVKNIFGTPKLSPKEEEEAFASYGRIRALRKKLDDALSGGEYQNAFEWRFEFPEVLDDEGNFLGFDCIIGNPPYIRQEQIKPLKPLLEKQYKDFYNSSADIYTYFFALAYHLLKEKGFNAFITSNKYARARYGTKLRELLLKKTTLVSYMELNALKVFESATVDTSIMSFIKQTPPKECSFNYYEPTPNDKDDLKNTPFLPMKQNALSTESFIFANTSLLDLRDKIESVGTPLKDWGIQIYRGILTGANEAFIIPTEKRDAILNACKTQEERERTEALIKPILRGKDIKRYSYEWAGEWVINTHNGYTSALKSKIPPVDIENYPAIKSHLDAHYDTIATRCDQGDTPYHLRNCAYLEDFEKEKIVYPCIMAKEPCFVYEEKGFYAPAPANIITGDKTEIKYITALLNSKYIYFAMRKFYMGGDIEGELKTNNLEKIPIPKITPKNQELARKITACAEAILEAKEKDPKANTQRLEKAIDALVYQLYNLTAEEIKIIEDGQ